MTSKSKAQIADKSAAQGLSSQAARLLSYQIKKPKSSAQGLSNHQMNKPKTATQEDYWTVNPR